MTGGAPAKLAQIKVVRKNIARALTVLSQQKRAAVRPVPLISLLVEGALRQRQVPPHGPPCEDHSCHASCFDQGTGGSFSRRLTIGRQEDAPSAEEGARFPCEKVRS